jgi:hypothetical protein
MNAFTKLWQAQHCCGWASSTKLWCAMGCYSLWTEKWKVQLWVWVMTQLWIFSLARLWMRIVAVVVALQVFEVVGRFARQVVDVSLLT